MVMAMMYDIKVNVMKSAKFLLLASVTVTMMMSAAAAGDGGNYNNDYGSSANTNQGSSNYYYHTPYPPPSSRPVPPLGTMPPVPYPPTSSPSPPSPSGVGCNPAEYPQALSELALAEQSYLNLKTKYYQDYKQLVILGKYNGTWDGYAKENLLKSSEVDKIRQIHEQYSAFVNYCYHLPLTGRQPSPILPVTHGGNIGTVSSPLPVNNSNNNDVTAATTKATTMTTVNDTLMELEPSISIPMWIKNNAKWWAEDQITDSDFIMGMQYLVSHKIIQLYSSSPTASLSSSTPTVLPQWVKGLAGSWADGNISDDYFVITIQSMVNQNIIKVSN